MQKAEWALLVIIIVTLFAVSTSLLVPLPPGNKPGDFYFNLTVSLATMLFYLGGSVIIIMGFGAFTNQFRKAYTILFTGLTFWALAYLQLPIMVITGLISSNVVISLMTIPFIASAILVFIGTRMLIKLFAVKTITTQWWVVLGIIITISFFTAIAPHTPGLTNELEFDMANILVMIAVTIFGVGAYHILLIKRRASVTFTNAFAWLCLSMAVLSVIAGAGSTLTTLIVKPEDAQLIFIMALFPSCIAAALFLRSAYSFSRIGDSENIPEEFVARDFFGNPIKPKTAGQVSSIDIVTHAVTLVSTREAIATLMDNVRSITAQLPLNPPLPLPPTTEAALKQVYLQIEDYLLTKEAIRKFTKETLRHDIAKKLHLTTASTLTFWSTLT